MSDCCGLIRWQRSDCDHCGSDFDQNGEHNCSCPFDNDDCPVHPEPAPTPATTEENPDD